MLVERDITRQIIKDLRLHEIVILHGTRQTGKTSLTKLVAKNSNFTEDNTFFFDFEDKSYRKLFNFENGGEQLLKNILKIESIDVDKKNLIIFDEIQLLDDPSNLLKLIHDKFPNLRIIATGSSSLQMKHKFSDSLAGRKSVFVVEPLNFDEFLRFKKQDKLLNIRTIFKEAGYLEVAPIIKANKDNFENLFDEYLTFGGYPEVVLTDSKKDKIRKLHSISDAYIQKDIREFANIENITAYNNLLKYLAINSGNLINISSVCSSLGLVKETVNKYINVLKETFIIGKAQPFYSNKTKEISKNFKLYFKDNGVRNLQILNFNLPENRTDKGIIYENYVFNALENNKNLLTKNYFYRTQSKTEIDFISITEEFASLIEVKSFNYNKTIRAFVGFEKKYEETFKKIEKIIINKSNLDIKNNIKYLPAYLL